MPTLLDRKDRKELRTGFSTGTAAAAAAAAAAALLKDGRAPDSVTVSLPKGRTMTVPVAEARLEGPVAVCVVVKDAGDDPDVTNRARIGARVRPLEAPGLALSGGPGVGRVTKPGLAIPPGEWAINPVPRLIIRDNLAPYLPEGGPGLAVEIFIEEGETLAKSTLNPRLGIVGGLSVLGTTGLVRPFSNSAYIATIDSALAIARAQGLSECVLTTGGRSEGFGRAARPDLPEEAFVQIADFFAGGLKLASKRGFGVIGLAVFFGKAVKQAAGHAYTHAHKADLDLSPLAAWLPELPENARARVLASNTALAALEVLKAEGLASLVPKVAKKALASAREYAGPGPDLWMRLFDFDGSTLAFEALQGGGAAGGG
ncbi:MAG: cobalt-precorrin-5B (C(1))-methyltransferase [Deltaproteobacteria bacterium]|jgi:cobalt-precorrin-5B (C1)-methyltransferase|nr:cobalt-precorrin-5B (C(1))-methyltransferase [Deltaproteobacteria bacterium]